jgi:nucleoside-triphosphatase THEP1
VSEDPPVGFAIRGEILSDNYALLATMLQRDRNPLHARITREDEIRVLAQPEMEGQRSPLV